MVTWHGFLLYPKQVKLYSTQTNGNERLVQGEDHYNFNAAGSSNFMFATANQLVYEKKNAFLEQ